mmetsp:Transcript_12940/g.48375  ORF Transcript_12940/g.48375 Transcript_12940/m.48375 type:complete len:261 (-) Transcript_12940:1841-2623(-)
MAFWRCTFRSSKRALTSGRSTGRSVRRTLLYVTTIRSRFPVCCRNVSPRWYVFIAASGIATFSNRKYFTSRKSFTSMGSKFTRKIPSTLRSLLSGRNRFILSFSSLVLSVSETHFATTSFSYKCMSSRARVNAAVISLASSVSMTSLERPWIFSNGCSMRSHSPRAHATAPANGGAFFAITGESFCALNILCTLTTSAPKSRKSSTCFFSKSAVIISRSSNPSKESKSLNACATVGQSSKPCVMILPKRRSNSFTVERKV